MHILVCHACDLMKNFQLPLKIFSQQGFEATHKHHKAIYYHSTSHDGKIGKTKQTMSSIKQILIKVYRVHFIEIFQTPEQCKQILQLN